MRLRLIVPYALFHKVIIIRWLTYYTRLHKHTMAFHSETHVEQRIRELIAQHVTARHPNIYALRNKKAVDILICKDGSPPELFFIEVKYHKANHGRLGFGSSKGDGFQPEILTKNPQYFEKNLRWALASERYNPEKVLFLHSSELKKYIAGGEIGEKFNNIQERIFREQPWFTEEEFTKELQLWLGGAGEA